VEFRDLCAWWPGVAALVITLLTFAIDRSQLGSTGRRLLYIAIIFLGVTAMAATIALQVMTAQERRETENREHERDKQVSEVKGGMAALLQLIPGLAAGEPEGVAKAREQITNLQAKLMNLEARGPRILSRTLTLSGPYTVAADFVPLGVLQKSITGHVDVGITGATGWSIGLDPTTESDVWAQCVSPVEGTQTTGADFLFASPFISHERDVYVVACGPPFTGGQITLTLIYDVL
jgi:hypothetical protein